ncbi:MAG: diphosphate--fructose-6-phosphate 1-phosphotransferase [Bryobacteraceae bacterium]|jgi:6-phosphofructokinase 1
MKNAAIAHGGGPTAVLNASLAAVCDAWAQHRECDSLFAAISGVWGILNNDFVDLAEGPKERISASAQAPGSIIGSSRQALTDQDYDTILEVFRKREIHCFFYTGGNGSMETALQLSRMARERRYELQVIGIPKTIDNDLAVTDHTPGYPSAARFFIHAARDIGLDNRALPSPVCILEALGRNTGWIAAATALARFHSDDPPHLIYFPERRLSLDRIAADVERVYRRIGRVVIVVCEGQLDDQGAPFGADVDRPDSTVHRLASNLAHTLAQELTRKLGLRARAEKPGLLGRSCGPLASQVDRKESEACGRAAVMAALAGETDKMVTLKRVSNSPYRCETGLTELANVARFERPLPDEWISAGANDIAGGFHKFLAPLVGELEVFPEMLSGDSVRTP